MTDPVNPAIEFVALGVQVRIAGDVGALIEPLSDLLDPVVPADGPAEVLLEVAADADPVAVLAELTIRIVEHSQLLICHAGLVTLGAEAIALPAPSGTGKSTLTVALARAGFQYLTDEAIGFGPTGRPVHGLRRPVSVAGDVWPLVLADQPDPPPPAVERPVRISTVAELADTICPRITQIVIPRRSTAPAPPSLTRASAGVAATALLHRSFNHFRNPAASLQTVLAVARGAECWWADYSDATELARLLFQQFGQPAAAAAR